MNLSTIFGILIGLLSAAAVAAIFITYRRGRAARKGRQGERIVAKELKSLGSADYIILNDITLPNGKYTSQIDHIVVSTRGVFVIETKSLSGRIAGSEHAQYWQQHLSSQSKSFYNPILQNKSHLRAVGKLFGENAASLFLSVIVFTEAWRIEVRADDIIIPRRWLPDRHIRRTFMPEQQRKRRFLFPSSEVRLDNQCVILTLDNLTEELSRREKQISRDTMHAIADHIRQSALTNRSIQKEHRQFARTAATDISDKIRNGVCPRCGAPLILKKGSNGEFVGCTNYPDCRFTCSIDRMR